MIWWNSSYDKLPICEIQLLLCFNGTYVIWFYVFNLIWITFVITSIISSDVTFQYRTKGHREVSSTDKPFKDNKPQRSCTEKEKERERTNSLLTTWQLQVGTDQKQDIKVCHKYNCIVEWSNCISMCVHYHHIIKYVSFVKNILGTQNCLIPLNMYIYFCNNVLTGG